MSKTKKIFSIALAILLCLQLLLVPTFADGETTEDTTTVTGKYTTADNLPAIYGAGELLDDFENVTLTDATSVASTQTNTILFAEQNYYNTKFSTVDAATYGTYGNNALKVSVAQPPNGFMIKVNDGGYNYAQKLKTKELAFYVNIPSQTVENDTTKGDAETYPDGKYGIFLISTDTKNQFNVTEAIHNNYTVTYYFTSGEKLVMKNQSGIYALDSSGNATTSGFKGYVSVDLTDTQASEYKYLFFKRRAPWEGKTLYFDDFRLVDSDVFLPYATIQDFDAIEAASGLKGKHTSSAGLWVNGSADPDVNIVDTGAAEGTTSLQFKTTKWGAICMNLKLKSSSAHKGIAFYVDIPASGWYGTPKFTLGFSKNYWDTSAAESLGSATYTYYFEDGSVLVKYGDDGIYPYDKNGNITAGQSFTGYVSIYYGNNDLSTNPYLHITVPADNSSALQQSGGYIYLDDFRFCDYNTVEDLVSGDAYYVNDTAIPVQKVGDTATLSVMTNLASLGMARNADGIAALRNVMLGYTTAAAKHNVNGEGEVDIRDLVALYTLAAQ